MKTKTILKQARKLISDPSKWCKGVFAKNKRGVKIDAKHAAACQWCAIGAVIACTPKNQFWGDASCELERALPRYFRKYSVSVFNDSSKTTHEKVMALFDRAIAAQP